MSCALVLTPVVRQQGDAPKAASIAQKALHIQPSSSNVKNDLIELLIQQREYKASAAIASSTKEAQVTYERQALHSTLRASAVADVLLESGKAGQIADALVMEVAFASLSES